VARAVRGACMSMALGVAAWGTVLAHADSPDWWISLGVYGSPASAGNAASGLGAGRDEMPRVVAFEQGGRTLHRVAVGPYAAGQPLRAALQAWRRESQGAFALRLGASGPPPAQAEVAAPSAPAARLIAAVEAAPAAAPAPVLEPAPAPEPDRAGDSPQAPVTVAESAPASAADPMAGLRLDPAMERLLRDDAALQRELERLSRGLPRGLGNEIEAAQAQGVSLQDARARTNTGPTSPAVAPPGYQLHHLRRDDVATDAED
jgi:hypothetical protein